MSIVTNDAKSLGAYLSESGATSSRSAVGSGTDRFAESLEQAIDGLGMSSKRISIEARTAGLRGAGLSGDTRQYLITVSERGSSSGEVGDEDGGNDGIPATGPRITKGMWTEEMLEGELPNSLFMEIQDKAEFLAARLERVQRPSEAVVRSDYDGSASPLNSSQLATRSQAEQVVELLAGLGIDAGEIKESSLGGPFSVEWGGEDRRHFSVSGHNVGLIIERYARYPKEVADQMMLDEFRV